MRIQVIASVVLGAASVCGCIQANPADGERVGAAEQPIFVDPPTPHGIVLLGEDALLFHARPLPLSPALQTPVLDEDDEGDGGDPK